MDAMTTSWLQLAGGVFALVVAAVHVDRRITRLEVKVDAVLEWIADQGASAWTQKG